MFDSEKRLIKVKSKKLKDRGQRVSCGCVLSKDIGSYSTCPYLCKYCYANKNKEVVLSNYKKLKVKRYFESITRF